MATAKETYINTFESTAQSFFTGLNETIINGSLNSMNTFLSKISDFYKNKSLESTSDIIDKETEEKKVNELKKNTYYNIKSIYEKVSSQQTDSNYITVTNVSDLGKLQIDDLENINLFYNFSNEECFGTVYNNKDSYDLYQIFSVVDRGNNDIGTKVLADLTYFYKNLYCNFDSEPISGQENQAMPIGNLTEGSFQMLFSKLATDSGFLFQQIPNYLNLNGALANSNKNDDYVYDVVDHMFGTHLDTDLFGSKLLAEKDIKFGGLNGLPGYIFQLGCVTSTLDTEFSTVRIKNDLTNSFQLDVGYGENNEKKVLSKNAPDDITKSNVTCFTVDFGAQKQQMFKNINLDTAQFYDTEESIRTWVDLINKKQQNSITTNIFPVLEKRSYTCSVESLGNATIQPLSYFYLRNVPLFTGTYWITNVSHMISPNNMTTTFQGVRQSIVGKNDTRQQLINLMKMKADDINNINKEANKIVTIGIPDTVGDNIKEVLGKELPYGEVLQRRKDDIGFGKFDGKTLIGAWIYSITNSDNDDMTNKLLISYLYNLSKAINPNTTNHATIINSMKNIAIICMKHDALNGDIRYIFENSNNLSISNLFKISGNSFTSTSKLSKLLDEIINIDVYITKIVASNDVDIYGVGAFNSKNTPIENNANKIIIIPDEKITTINSKSINLKEVTMYLDPKSPSYANDRNNGIDSGKEITLFTLFNTLGTQGRIISVNNSKQIINTNGNFNVKYLGGYLPELSKDTTQHAISFFGSNQGGEYGKINMSQHTINMYLLDIATEADKLNINQTIAVVSGGRDRLNYISSLINVAKVEIINWDNGTLKECDENAKGLLKKYWSVVGVNNPKCDTAWSAVFISYVVKTAGNSDFPYSASHGEYIEKCKNNKLSWKGYKINDVAIQLGDILCYGRDNGINTEWKDISSNTPMHGEIVIQLDVQNNYIIATTISGNYSNSVNKNTIYLDSKGKLIFEKTPNKYKGLIRYELADTNSNKSTQITNEEQKLNQVKVKEILKAKNYSKVAVAGIMGNIQQESGFNHKIVNEADNNGYDSVGLIQFNGYSHGSSKKAVNIFNTVGHTVEEQIAYLMKMSTFNDYTKIVANITDTSEAAYQFAFNVERCQYCIKKDNYIKHESNRSKYAVDFFNRFNKSGDSLQW